MPQKFSDFMIEKLFKLKHSEKFIELFDSAKGNAVATRTVWSRLAYDLLDDEDCGNELKNKYNEVLKYYRSNKKLAMKSGEGRVAKYKFSSLIEECCGEGAKVVPDTCFDPLVDNDDCPGGLLPSSCCDPAGSVDKQNKPAKAAKMSKKDFESEMLELKKQNNIILSKIVSLTEEILKENKK